MNKHLHTSTLPFWVRIAAPLLLVTSYFPVRFHYLETFSTVGQFSIMLFALPALYGFWRTQPTRRWILLLLSVYALGIEALSITTGFPYGFFTYGDKLGFQFAGIVPWNIPFSWIPLAIGAYYFIDKLSPTTKPLTRLLLYVVILTSIDLVLDPAAVALGFWSYLLPGAYFGVPLSNFAGWIFSSVVSFTVLSTAKVRTLPPEAVHSLFLMLAFWTGCCLWLGLTAPFGIGCLLLIISSTFLLRLVRRD